jgi:hypothetical protein
LSATPHEGRSHANQATSGADLPCVRPNDTLAIPWRWFFCQCGSDKVDIDRWDNQRMLLKCFTCERTAWVDGFTVGKLDFVEQLFGAARYSTKRESTENGIRPNETSSFVSVSNANGRISDDRACLDRSTGSRNAARADPAWRLHARSLLAILDLDFERRTGSHRPIRVGGRV